MIKVFESFKQKAYHEYLDDFKDKIINFFEVITDINYLEVDSYVSWHEESREMMIEINLMVFNNRYVSFCQVDLYYDNDLIVIKDGYDYEVDKKPHHYINSKLKEYFVEDRSNFLKETSFKIDDVKKLKNIEFELEEYKIHNDKIRFGL